MLKEKLIFRIRLLLCVIMAGLLISGFSVFILESTFNLLLSLFGIESDTQLAELSDITNWLITVRKAIDETNSQYPFLAYLTDWLGFAHFIIATAFIGALRDPVRNA